MKRLYRSLLVALIVLAAAYITWDGLAFARYCRVPPFGVTVAFYLLFFTVLAGTWVVAGRVRAQVAELQNVERSHEAR